MDLIKLTKDSVTNLLPCRSRNAHKGTVGRVLMLCGSVGYTGAAALSAMGALRCGSGMVFLAVPESIYAIEAVKLTEPVVLPMPEVGGMLSVDALQKIRELMRSASVILMGPGLGRSEQVQQVVKTVLREFRGPVVLDADGIFAIAEHKDILRDRVEPVVLTPHEGEFVRLAGQMSDDRISDAVKTATDLGQILLLKGPDTVITDGKTVYVNPTGNPGMAVGGCGDVLAGMIAALIGQGVAPLQAAACGAWLHGAAGDLCARELGQMGMLPTDMLTVLPRLLK